MKDKGDLLLYSCACSMVLTLAVVLHVVLAPTVWIPAVMCCLVLLKWLSAVREVIG